MQWIDGLTADDLKDETVIVRVQQTANELAKLKHDA